MSQPIKLGFVGMNSMDICIYLGAIFANLKYQILILDFSTEQLIQYAILHPQGSIKTVHYQGVDYANFQLADMANNEIYDYVFFFFGKECSLIYKEMDFTELIFVTDCQRDEVKNYHEIIGQIHIPSTVIFRSALDSIWLKTTIVKPFKEHCFLVESYVIPYDEMDENYRILMQYEPYTQFLQISKTMEKTLIDLTRATLQCSRKKALDALKSAKKGACV